MKKITESGASFAKQSERDIRAADHQRAIKKIMDAGDVGSMSDTEFWNTKAHLGMHRRASMKRTFKI